MPILDLPEKFSITFWARWDALNKWSRIFDFGNGASSNNILVGNQNSDSLTIRFSYYVAKEILIDLSIDNMKNNNFYSITYDNSGS